MPRVLRLLLLIAAVAPLGALSLLAQKAPPSPRQAWPVPVDARIQSEIAQATSQQEMLDPAKQYTLAELIDIAESHNPETRTAWERAKQSAARLGVARSALYPLVAAMASASLNQYALFFGKFYREDTGLFPATLNLSYVVLDFGGRRARIDAASAGLSASDFAFNDTHRRLVFDVARAYYQLLDAMGREAAAQATLTDARTVQEAAEDRLAHGLATLPDVLEARAATAQAQYELTSIQGLESVSRGALATILRVSPAAPFRVQDVSQADTAARMEEPVEEVMGRAMTQRPDLLAQAERIRESDAEIRRRHAAFYPLLSLSGDWGHMNSFGQQDLGPVAQSSIYPYRAEIKLEWDIFDGGARKSELAGAEADSRRARSDLATLEDRIQQEVWASYIDLKTAQQQQEAADALFQAASQSYSAAVDAYRYGVRTFIDVTSAQRDLARARTAQVTARTEVLKDAADLAFQAGDQLQAAQPQATP